MCCRVPRERLTLRRSPAGPTSEPPPAPAAEVNVCVTSLRLAVTPSMVPLGRLLVFYVRENGEGVADSLQFAVETFFENQVEHRCQAGTRTSATGSSQGGGSGDSWTCCTQ